MQRLIVTSATYRQSSRVTPDRLEKDPYNRLFSPGTRSGWRPRWFGTRPGDQRALEANDRRPERLPLPARRHLVCPVQRRPMDRERNGDQYRRGLYTYWRRSAPYPSFIAFDAPSREVCPSAGRGPTRPCRRWRRSTIRPSSSPRPPRRPHRGGIEGNGRRPRRLCVPARARPQAVPAELGHLVELYAENLERYRRDPAAAAATAMVGLATIAGADGCNGRARRLDRRRQRALEPR